MEFDYSRCQQKEKELKVQILGFLGAFIEEEQEKVRLSELIFSTSVNLTPPEKEELRLQLITMTTSGRGGGKSLKPGNIRLNIGKLMESVANCVFAVVSSYQVPWLAPFAFIMLWKSLWAGCEVELTENDAALIYTMWTHRDRSINEISKDGLLMLLNTQLSKYERSNITQKDLDFSISRLVKVGCIKQSQRHVNNWWLCEWVQPVYT